MPFLGDRRIGPADFIWMIWRLDLRSTFSRYERFAAVESEVVRNNHRGRVRMSFCVEFISPGALSRVVGSHGHRDARKMHFRLRHVVEAYLNWPEAYCKAEYCAW